MIGYVREGARMGINRWQGGIERRKRNEADAKASDIEEETPQGEEGRFLLSPRSLRGTGGEPREKPGY